MSTGRSTLVAGATLLAALGGGIAPAAACGLEDPSSVGVRRGTLNIAFPQSLHVGTAVWQAQLAGRLPRDPVAQRTELPPQVRGQLRLMQATLAMRRLAAALATDVATEGRPVLAVVLVGPVLWTRIEPGAPAAEAQVHATGPEPGDVVLVTESVAAEALASGALGLDEALQLGLLRLYGPAADTHAALYWLRGTLRGPRT
jgi:hypothetical protein